MIYILFTVSLIVCLLLKIGKVYYEYFSITTSPKNDKDKEHRKSNFPWTPQIFVWSFQKSRKPNWIIKGNKSVERKLSIIKSLSHFTFIFCIVAFIFSLLQFWLDTSTQVSTATATILKIEETQFKIKEFVSHFKIGFGYDILIVFLLITFAGSFPILEKYKAKDKLKKFNKAIKGILFFLTISTSFTFFGNRFVSDEEGRVGELEIHKLQIFEENKLLLKKINDAVTYKVVNEVISNPELEKVFDKVEEVKKSIEEAKQDDEYENFVLVAPTNFVNELPLTSFESSYSGKYDFRGDFEKAESKFQSEYSKNSSAQSDFYKTKEEIDYANFKERNQSWYTEKEFTASSAKQADETFVKASEASSTKYAKYYSKYKEPIEKLIKKGYSKTGGKFIKNFFEAIGVDFPFLGELIDPIINEPIQDYITQKTESIFKNCMEKKMKEVEAELKNCSVDFKNIIKNSVNNSDKFNNLVNELNNESLKLKDCRDLTKKKIHFELTEINRLAAQKERERLILEEIAEKQRKLQLAKADKHLKTICSKSRWERLRKLFQQGLNGEIDIELSNYSYTQINNFKSVLNNWDIYKDNHKLEWYLMNSNDIEEFFFNYSKSNGNIKACWGYILQFDSGLPSFYMSNPHLKWDRTGKPYYTLQYYYYSIGKANEFESLYDVETENGIGIMCPH